MSADVKLKPVGLKPFPAQPAYDAGTLSLEGARVTLRRPSPADARAIHRRMNDYDVVKNLSRAPWPYDLSDAESWLNAIESGGPERSAYPFAIVTSEGLVGVIGISRHEDAIELGYWLGRDSWGKGYATEAARLVLGFAFDQLGLDDIEAGHFADNAASGRVLQKVGFAYTGTVARYSRARDCDVDCRMMILPRSAFAADKNDSEGGTAHGG